MPELKKNWINVKDNTRPEYIYPGEIAVTGRVTANRMYTSASVPSSTNDGFDSAGISQSFFEGDFWYYTGGILYKCSDNTQNAAIWEPLNSAQRITSVSGSSYTILGTDDFISVSYAGAVSLQLPSASTVLGRIFTISDSGANAGSYNITINRAGSDTIVSDITGETSIVINSDGVVIRLAAIDSTTWKVW